MRARYALNEMDDPANRAVLDGLAGEPDYAEQEAAVLLTRDDMLLGRDNAAGVALVTEALGKGLRGRDPADGGYADALLSDSVRRRSSSATRPWPPARTTTGPGCSGPPACTSPARLMRPAGDGRRPAAGGGRRPGRVRAAVAGDAAGVGAGGRAGGAGAAGAAGGRRPAVLRVRTNALFLAAECPCQAHFEPSRPNPDPAASQRIHDALVRLLGEPDLPEDMYWQMISFALDSKQPALAQQIGVVYGQRHPDDPAWRYRLARAGLDLGNPFSALRLLEESVAGTPPETVAASTKNDLAYVRRKYR